MSNKTILVLLLIILCSLLYCEDQALLKKQLYNLENIIIEEKLDLKEEQYTFSLNFIAVQTSSAYMIVLAYPNISQSEEISDSDYTHIINSLYGCSLELYATVNNELIHSIIITENNKPYIDKQTVSLLLGDKISLIKNTSYELRLTMPGKKNTKDRYTTPILVVGKVAGQ